MALFHAGLIFDFLGRVWRCVLTVFDRGIHYPLLRILATMLDLVEMISSIPNPFWLLRQYEIEAMGLRYMGRSWRDALRHEFEKFYFVEEGMTESGNPIIGLAKFVAKERCEFPYKVFPPSKLVFNWTQHCPIDQVKVVIVGQDPYPGEYSYADGGSEVKYCTSCDSVRGSNADEEPYLGLAHGLAFSARGRNLELKELPKSLQNIFEEVERDYDTFEYPGHGDLTGWAKQGVVLLNTVLTVRAGLRNGHRTSGWMKFTDEVIRCISSYNSGVVFLLWGEAAKEKAHLIDTKKHRILTCSHPSPLSVNATDTPFSGCGHFSKTNRILVEEFRKSPIMWQNL